MGTTFKFLNVVRNTVVCTLYLIIFEAEATNYIWSGSGSSSLGWNDPNNWTPYGYPGQGPNEIAKFVTIIHTSIINVSSTPTYAVGVESDITNPITFQGESLEIVAVASNNPGYGWMIFENPLEIGPYSSGYSLSVIGVSATFQNTISDSPGNPGLLSIVSGTSVGTPSQAVTLSAPNTYTGGTLISSGWLSLNGSGSLYSKGTVALGDLIFSDMGFDISGISLGSVTIGPLQDAPSSSNFGSVALGSKTLNFGNGSTGDFIFSGTISGSSGSINLFAGTYTATLAGDNSGNNFNAQISSGILALSGSGRISNTGSLTLSGGTFDISALSASTNVTIGDLYGTSGVLNLGSNILTFGTSKTTSFSGSIQSNSGTLTKVGSGTFSITGTNTFTGTTNVIISAGTIQSSFPCMNLNSSSSVTIESNAFLNLAGGGSFLPSINFQPSSTFTVSSSGTLSSVMTSSVNGAGTLVFSGSAGQVLSITSPNTHFSGVVEITNGGILSIDGSSGDLGSSEIQFNQVPGGILRLTQSTLSLFLNSVILNSSATIISNLTSGSATLSRFSGYLISGSGSLTTQGPTTLSLIGNSNYTGDTIVQSGTLQLEGLLYDGVIPGNLTISSGATLDMSLPSPSLNVTVASLSGSGTLSLGANTLQCGNNSHEFTFSGSIQSNSGTITKIGSDTFSITGTNTFTGTANVIISGGTIQSSFPSMNLNSSSSVTIESNASLNLAGGGSFLPSINFQPSSTFTVSSSGTLSSIMTSSASNAGTLIFSGSANQILTITGVSTFEGLTQINNGGSLNLNATGSLGTGIISFVDQTSPVLILSPSSTTTYQNPLLLGVNTTIQTTTSNVTLQASPVITGSGSLTFSGTTSSSLTLDGTSSYTGDTIVQSGTLSIKGAIYDTVASGNLSVANGAIFDMSPGTLTGSVTVSSLQGQGTLNLGNNTLNFGNSEDFTFSGFITQAASTTGSITKIGSGIATFLSNSPFTAYSYAGSLDINGGSFVTVTSILPIGNPVSIASGACLQLNDDQTVTFSSNISGDGSLIFAGSGVLSLTGLNTFSGGTKIKRLGTVILTNPNCLGTGTITFSSAGGTLQSSTSLALLNGLSFNSSGTLNTTASGLTITVAGSVAGSGNFIASGSGSIVLTGSYSSFLGNLSVLSGNFTLHGATPNFGGNINLANGANLTFAPLASGTYSQVISGGGAVTINSPSNTVYFTGSNSYSGMTTIQNGTLNVFEPSIVSNVLIHAGACLQMNVPSIFNYQGIIAGGGTLQVLGPSSLTLMQSAPLFTGSITVLSPAHLEIDADYSETSLVQVNAGARFSGNGKITNLSNDGTLIPGDPGIGILTVTDHATFSSSSVFESYISPSTSNLLLVENAASLDGLVLVVPSPGFYGIEKQYVILQANSIAGNFTNVTSEFSFFQPTLLQTTNQVLLNIEVLDPFYNFPFENYNEEQVGNNLNQIMEDRSASPDLINTIDAMGSLSTSGINNALNQLHPAAFSAISDLQAELGAQLLSLFARNPELSCGCHGKSRAWVQPFGNWLKQAHHGMQRGFHATTRGLAFGYDVELLNCWTLGLGGAYSKTDLRWSRHAGYSYVETAIGAVYSDLWFGDFYLGLSGYLGKDFYELHRRILYSTIDRQANSSSNAIDAAGQFKAMYVFGTKSFFLYPYALVDYMALNNSSFTEHGADSLNLHVSRYKSENLRAQGGFGLRFIDHNIENSFCISPLFSMGYVLEHPLHRSHFHSRFQGQTILFESKGWNRSWHLLNLELGLTFSYKCFSLDAEYIADVSTDTMDDFFNQRANFNFKLNF